MKTKETLGIDISKSTIDAWLYLRGLHHSFANSKAGIGSMTAWIKQQAGLSLSDLLICFEHTGKYSLALATYLTQQSIDFSMVSGLEVKKSLGIQRGKNDKVDAQRIAEYAHQRIGKLKAYQLPIKAVQQLKDLLRLRVRLVKQRTGYLSSIKECKATLLRKDNEELFACQERMIAVLDKQIKKLELKAKSIIKEDQKLAGQYDLITSVKGVGFVLGCNLLVSTNCFKNFENSRQFACYAGIAPFKHQSGTSLNRKSRVSHYANKNIKALLDRAACSAIQHDAELKKYYQARIATGKSRRSTLNVVRNKIVSRVFAVIKRGTPYISLYKHAA